MSNPYIECPIYESDSFIIRLVSENDASGLLKCYSDIIARPFFNSDTCTSDFYFNTLDDINNCIKLWIFNRGILRVDICSEYENESYLSKIFGLCVKNFYNVFDVDFIATKAIPHAINRISSLKSFGFKEYEFPDRENFFIRSKYQ